MVVMLKMHMNGFIITISLMRPALHIKLLDMIMVLDVHLSLNVKIVSLKRDVGLNKELKYMESMNLDKFKDNKT